jgi:hypothetical protein
MTIKRRKRHSPEQIVRDERAKLRVRLRDLQPAVCITATVGCTSSCGVKVETWAQADLYRLYVEEGLQMRAKRPCRHESCQVRRQQLTSTRLNESWSMDFMAVSCGGSAIMPGIVS